MSSAVETLLADLAASIPALTGAKCAGKSDLFDAAGEDEDRARVQARFATALDLCASCRCQSACREWLQSLPVRKRPAGVVAGTVVRPGLRVARTRVA